jgi:hypothetical protein
MAEYKISYSNDIFRYTYMCLYDMNYSIYKYTHIQVYKFINVYHI